MRLHRNAKLGLAGRHALVKAVDGGLSVREAARRHGVSPATACAVAPLEAGGPSRARDSSSASSTARAARIAAPACPRQRSKSESARPGSAASTATRPCSSRPGNRIAAVQLAAPCARALDLRIVGRYQMLAVHEVDTDVHQPIVQARRPLRVLGRPIERPLPWIRVRRPLVGKRRREPPQRHVRSQIIDEDLLPAGQVSDRHRRTGRR